MPLVRPSITHDVADPDAHFWAAPASVWMSYLSIGAPFAAGADHCSVLTARARVDPVSDPRSDWFVRRLPSAVEDTIPG